MPKASDYKPETRFIGMFVGDSGCGKSAAAMSFPGPKLDLDFDLRFAGIADMIKQGIINGDDAEYEQFPPVKGLDKLNNLLMQWDMQRKSGTFPYKTISVSSLGALTRVIMNEAHILTKGKMIGKYRISGGGDYNFEAQLTHQTFDYLRMYPCNLICNAHIVPKFGKAPGANEYAQAEVIGEKLAVTGNLGVNVLTYFDNVFRFSREEVNGKMKYYVEFATDLAKNTYGIDPGKHDITGKNFYNYLQELTTKKGN